jgi:formate dehydrogenase iron-sulfur subunit
MIAVAALKLRGETTFLARRDDREDMSLRRSALLLDGPLAPAWRLRVALCVVGGIALPIYWIALGPASIPADGAAIATLAFLVAIAGELAERCLFFAAVVRPKMPGGMVS